MTSSCDTATAGMTHGGGESKFRVSSACKRALSRNADRSLVPVKCAALDDAEAFRSVGSLWAAVIITSRASASTARSYRCVRRYTRNGSLVHGAGVRSDLAVSQRMNQRRVESMRCTVASLQVVWRSSPRGRGGRAQSERPGVPSSDATSSRASSSAGLWSASEQLAPVGQVGRRALSLWHLNRLLEGFHRPLGGQPPLRQLRQRRRRASGGGVAGLGTSGLYRRVRRDSPISPEKKDPSCVGMTSQKIWLGGSHGC